MALKKKVKKVAKKAEPEAEAAPPKKEKKAEKKAKAPSSPKAEAPSSPKITGKKEKKEAKEPAEGSVSPEEKARLAAEAMKEILKALGEADPAKGTQGMPDNWHIKYKLALGSYKKFAKQQTDKLVVVDRENGNFVVAKKGDKNIPAPPPPGQLWKRCLTNAWNSYCKAVDKEDRSVENFVASLPKGARDSKPDGASPAKTPKAAPAKAQNTKKRKAEDDDDDEEEEEAMPPMSKLKAKKKKKRSATSPN
mmetsp:Transcript_87137/g.188659  ORF Transcript_87137/g.188659 Transcript_87137/m.188659 type:complete len:250 (-) Transcript_87137:43-792(-)